LRGDWEEHKKIVQGVPVKKVFPKPSSFLGFHLLTPPTTLANLWHRNRRIDDASITIPPIEIPFGPYGGLFFHKNLISKIGYPNELFFLYNDDTEYTSRLTNNGGKLFLVSSSLIHDLDHAWQTHHNGESFFSHFLINNSDLRIYYVARNQSYLESHLWLNNLTVYTLNKWAFFFFLSLFALKHRKWSRFALIARAVREGRDGQLGRFRDLENP
jgi:GT2 family glycosyltransferase